MSDLTIKNEGAIQTALKYGTETAIKPLEKEIYLKDVYLKGVLFHEEKTLTLKEGDTLILKREPQLYDPFIVSVYNGEELLGELDEFEEEVFSNLLDAGKKLVAKVSRVIITPDYNALLISVSMIDF